MQLTQPSLQVRRRRAKWRAWHRGMQELDIVLGRYADAQVDAMDEPALEKFEDVLMQEDTDLFAWLVRGSELPPEQDSALMRQLLEFSAAGLQQ